MTILVLWANCYSTLFVRTDSFSNENGVSLRLCNVQKLVLPGPCFADINVEKVGLYHRKFGLFGGVLEQLFKICGRFVGSLCMLVVEALRCHFVFLWL